MHIDGSIEGSSGATLQMEQMVPPIEGEDYITIQWEIMRRLFGRESIGDLTDEDGTLWVTRYSEVFCQLIHGHKEGDGYQKDKDTQEAQEIRALYFQDKDAFYERVVTQLKAIIGQETH